MSTGSLAALCAQARTELQALGDFVGPLMAIIDTIEERAAGRGADALDDATFALEVLTATSAGDAVAVGRVTEFLRQRASEPTPEASLRGRVGRVTVAAAVEEYERGALAVMARGTQHTYRTWTKRLVEAHGAAAPDALSAGDLTDLIAQHVLAGRSDDDRRTSGRSATENAVAAYRHLWGYLVEKRYATSNVATRLRKPTRVESRRRGFTLEESALLRELARAGHDPLLDEITLVLPERLGLRRTELCRLRLRDIDFTARSIEVWGKGDKYRTVPVPPQLFEHLERYAESRRPSEIATEVWRRSAEALLRRPPTASFPLGRAAGRRRIEDLFSRLQRHAPDLFAAQDVSLHSYRHALGTYTDRTHGRAVTRAVLGHTSRRSPTDHYVHVPLAQVADVLAQYEAHLLAWPSQNA